MSVNATNAIPIAAGISRLKSSNVTSGRPNEGSPAGTDPTTATSSSSPNSATTAVAPTTAMNTPGIFGATRRKPKITSSDPAPIASAVPFVSSSPSKNPRRLGRKFSASTEKPNRSGSCDTITVTAMPAR